MAYLALYRKYRSKTFEEIVGQEPIVKTLKNALLQNKVAHAYLFSGPRGTGKTSIARLFAKALNCEQGLGHQCNVCENCKAMNNNSHPDVIEIDAASNNSVDDARSLIEKVRYSPMLGKYKVYIIDEVHMMSSSAFNALLKTLEEPPSYVVFILCTTEPHKVLPTIVSRCQHYEFKKIDDKDLIKLIKKVLLNEGVSASDEAIHLITELANGGARDALSLLDQIIAYSDKRIEVSDIEQIFGLTSISDKITLLKFISKGDTLNVLNKFNQFINKNVDVERLVSELLVILKDILIYQKTKNIDLLVSLNEISVKELSDIFLNAELNNLISLFMDCQKEFKITNNPTFTFEIYLLKSLEVFNSVNEIEISTNSDKNIEFVPPKEPENNKINPSIEELNKTKEEEKMIVPQETIIQNLKEETKEIDIFNPALEIENEEKEKLENIKKVFKTSIKIEKLSNEGEIYSINDDSIIKILVNANKEERLALFNNWKLFENYLEDANAKELSEILLDECNIYARSEDYTILVCNKESLAIKLNRVQNQEIISNFIKDVTKTKKTFVYVLDRIRKVNISNKFYNLDRINKLPSKDEIANVKIEKENLINE